MIVHVDMDAFFAAVEIRDNPNLSGKPVAVGGSPEGRGVVATANYEARKYGIHSAMPAASALRRCRSLIFLPVQMEKYAEVSQQIREIFYRYTPEVEPLSLDEAFLGVEASERLFGTAVEIGQAIKLDIANELNLVASVGVAKTKFVAKVASDIHKPNGFVFVEPGRESEFLDPLPISRLWGVGKVAEPRFRLFSLNIIRDVRQSNPRDLVQEFGKLGQKVWELANGIDPRKIESESTSKSISHETTFSVDIADIHSLRSILMNLTESVASRLRRKSLKAKTVTLKLRLADFSRVTRSKTLPCSTDSTDEIWSLAQRMLQQYFKENRPVLRLIGVAAGGLEGGENELQKDLFADVGKANPIIDKVTDLINLKFGSKVIHRASTQVRPKK